MHYHAEVWIKDKENVEAEILRIMAPYDETLEVEQYTDEGDTYWINPSGFWDWYQIGGRWKGTHVPGYKPSEDPDHLKTCDLCLGSGDRPGWVYYEEGERHFKDDWAEKCNGCNGCKGTGQSVKWPTDWDPHELDVIPVSQIPDDLDCHTLIVNGEVFQIDYWDRTSKKIVDTEFKGSTVKVKLDELGITDGYLVTVDYHN